MASRTATFRVPTINSVPTKSAGRMPAVRRPNVRRATVYFRHKDSGTNFWVNAPGKTVCAEDGSFASTKTTHFADLALIARKGPIPGIPLVRKDMSASRAKTTGKGLNGVPAE
mgnify:CR=1 FL=1